MTQGAHLTYFRALEKLADISRQEIAAIMPHMGERGRIVEEVFKATLGKILPRRFSIGSGVIVNVEGKVSGQQDVIIYDHQLNAPILSEHSSGVFPIECVYATVEVKATLTKASLLQTMKSIGVLRSLQSAKKHYLKWEMVERGSGHIARPVEVTGTISPRSYIFAFNSPLRADKIIVEINNYLSTTNAHIHGALILNRQLYLHTKAHQNPPQITIITENAFTAFFQSLLVGISTFNMAEMNFFKYLNEPANATPNQTALSPPRPRRPKRKV